MFLNKIKCFLLNRIKTETEFILKETRFLNLPFDFKIEVFDFQSKYKITKTLADLVKFLFIVVVFIFESLFVDCQLHRI